MTDLEGHGPDHDAVVAYICEKFAGVDVVTAMGATFFSLDPETHWPNFATIVTTDEHDMGAPSNLSARPGVFRLNLGVDKATFERYVAGDTEPDYAALDAVLPHPVYAAQRWLSILSPSWRTWNETVIPLLGIAHHRLVAQRARHAPG
ncbi:MAG TPA: DUF6194 family protein [Methylomirabilota bacterium]|nr:DUF6194 family protein [Methylomirabilota bacterium]